MAKPSYSGSPAYLVYARDEEPRWRALFEHRLPPRSRFQTGTRGIATACSR